MEGKPTETGKPTEVDGDTSDAGDAYNAGDGGKKDETDGKGVNGDTNAEEKWHFALPKPKKKGKKGNAKPEPQPKVEPTTITSSFDKINLDDTSPPLDLNFETTDLKTSNDGGIGASTSGRN
jgi:hypothetical protein